MVPVGVFLSFYSVSGYQCLLDLLAGSKQSGTVKSVFVKALLDTLDTVSEKSSKVEVVESVTVTYRSIFRVREKMRQRASIV